MTALLTLLYTVGLGLGLAWGTGPQRVAALVVLGVVGARAAHRRALRHRRSARVTSLRAGTSAP